MISIFFFFFNLFQQIYQQKLRKDETYKINEFIKFYLD